MENLDQTISSITYVIDNNEKKLEINYSNSEKEIWILGETLYMKIWDYWFVNNITGEQKFINDRYKSQINSINLVAINRNKDTNLNILEKWLTEIDNNNILMNAKSLINYLRIRKSLTQAEKAKWVYKI